MRALHIAILTCIMTLICAPQVFSQEYGQPDRGQPGDEMIQQYLKNQAEKIHESFSGDIESPEHWKNLRPQYKEEYFYMLGLAPMPPKTPLKPTVTGTLQGDGYVVDMLHYQSIPRLYVTANLYRPSHIEKGAKLPAVLYVCGHSYRGRNGNKTAYQSHGIWFARHGYICLTLDSLQLGEIAAIHHGTYREGRWWWHSRGYTPAGVECLNGVRGIDYLISRPDVDPERIAVTGISGGGAATYWIACADERVKVAVPVSGMADLPSYVSNRVINGHCDCMFLYNTFHWPWTRIAALIAPHPMLFTNSDHDTIFPMDANQRVINRLERIYSLYGASDFVDSFVSIGGHAYRQDIRQAAYRFINIHLKNDPSVVVDSEVDLVTGEDNDRKYPIAMEKLRVFPEDSDLPTDELNTTIDQHFVPMANVNPPEQGQFETWKSNILAELHRVVFRSLPERIEPAKHLQEITDDAAWLESEPGIKVHLTLTVKSKSTDESKRLLLIIKGADSTENSSELINLISKPGDMIYTCTPRGIDQTCWTRKNPPNYVERSHVLLGTTVDTGRVLDIIATARYIKANNSNSQVYLAGQSSSAILATYAALLEPDIAGVIAVKPPLTHMNNDAPQFLNVLRVCDIPDAMGMLAPRSLTIYGIDTKDLNKVSAIYACAESATKLDIKTD